MAAGRSYATAAAALRSVERTGHARGLRRRNPAKAGDHEDRLKFLRRFADDRIKPEIESVEGSAAVKVSGGFEDEVQIYVDQQRLAQLKLSIEQVAKRIGAENVNLSGGRLEQGTQRFLVRTVNEFDTLEDMANAVIANVDGQPVYLKDVARVDRGYKDRTAITRLNGDECIELAIYKEGDANTVQLAQGIRGKLEALEKTLPGGTKLVPVYDQSKFIASAVSDVKDAAILGGLLSILVLYFFLRDAWATIVTGIVIPVTVVGIFVMMYAFDLTLNVMSLGGIALSVGMLIDNSVVILEAIARRKEAGPRHHRCGARRHGGSGHGGHRLHADFGRGLLPDGVRERHRRTVVPRPGAHRHVCPAHFAHGRHYAGAHADRLARAPRRQGSRARAPMPASRARRWPRCAATCAHSVSNFRVGTIVARESAPTPRVAFRHSSGGSRRRFAGCCACSAGAAPCVTFLVRVLRIVFGFLGKVFAVLLSPFVWITQKSYNVLDRHYPGFSTGRWSAAPPCCSPPSACSPSPR